MTTKTQRLAAQCFAGLAKEISNQSAPVKRVTKWEGAGHSFPNLIRDYERYGHGAKSWFKPAEVAFFKTKLEGAPLDFPALGVTLFMTSERGPADTARGWSIRAYLWASAEIVTISDFFDRQSAHTTEGAFDLLWRVLSGQDLAKAA